MRFIRQAILYLYANVNLLNIALFLAAIAVVVFAVLPLLRTTVRFTLPQVKAKTVQKEAVSTEKAQTPSLVDYAMVGENNLFHPERRIPPLKTEEKVLPKPELVLYGTIIGGGTAVAYVEDKKSPRSTPGRGNRQQVAKKGDVFNGFVLKEIEADSISLVRGEETMTVYLSQEKKGRGGDSSGASSVAGQQSLRPPPIAAPARPNAGAPPPAPQPAQPAFPAQRTPGRMGKRITPSGG